MNLADTTKSRVQTEEAYKARQPQCFDHFHCIGTDCEDTCCVGWGIPVDQGTYEKYQSLPHQRIADRTLSSLVEINPARTSTGDYAKIQLEGARCPALHNQLCSIQLTLGEPYMPDLCNKYPRVLNRVGTAIQRFVSHVVRDPRTVKFGDCREARLSIPSIFARGGAFIPLAV